MDAAPMCAPTAHHRATTTTDTPMVADTIATTIADTAEVMAVIIVAINPIFFI